MSQLKSGQSCDIAFVAVALSVPRHSPPRASLHQTIPESLMLCSKDRHPWFVLRSQEGAAPVFSTHAMYRCLPGHTPFPAPARSILPPSLDHPASCIQNPASAFPMKLLLIDGHYYVYRSFFAIPNLSNSRGEPTNAIFGFTKTLRLMLKHLQPEFGAVVWDEGVPQKRVELQPAYKETRKEMPQPMIPQLDFIQKLTPLLGFQNISLPNTEADDLMGCYAIAASQRGWEVILATNDKDLFQLVNAKVKIYTTAKADLVSPKDTFALLGEPEVVAKWDVQPEQIGEVLAIAGDSVDNIPGAGIGRKAAAALIREHGGLEALLNNLDRVKSPRSREKLLATRDQILQNRKMVELDCSTELPVSLDALRIAPDYPALLEALEACEFKSLLQEVRDEASKAGTARQSELLL